jgi:hypothetical protein
VDGTNGENVLIARGATLEDAYRLVCVQARAVGMLVLLGLMTTRN